MLLGCTAMYAQCACQPLGCAAPVQPYMRKAPSNSVIWLSTRPCHSLPSRRTDMIDNPCLLVITGK